MNKLNYYFEMSRKIKTPLIIPKLWNYLKYRAVRKQPVVTHYTPQICGILLINRCNLQCDYCGFVKDGAFKEPKQEVTLDIVKRMFSHKLLKNCLLVDLLGGEPLLCNDFVPIVKFLSGRGYLTNTSTNGLLLADRIQALKDAGITRINVSIYPENFEILKNSLPRINKIYQVHTSFVLTKTILEKNRQFVFDVVNLAHASGCKSLRFWMYRSLGKIPDFDEVVTEDSPAYIDFKAQVTEKYKDFILFPQLISVNPKKRCTQLWQRTGVSPDGTIGPCCGNMGVLQNANLFQNSFEEIYNCDKIVEVRNNLLDNTVPPLEPCRTCNLLRETGW